MRFSRRTAWDTSEGELARAVRKAGQAGEPLLDLTISNPTRCGFVYDIEAIVEALVRRESLIYEPDARGMRSAREAVAEYYAEHSAQVDPDALLLTTSTSEAYSFVFRLLCDAGDEVLVAQPSYPLFDFMAALDDVRLESYPTFYDYGWSIDFAELERQIGPRTRALVLVHPNNPTGHATGAAELEDVRAVCARHGLALIVDEVFLDYGLEYAVESVGGAQCGGIDLCGERAEQGGGAAADEGGLDSVPGARERTARGAGAAGGGGRYVLINERACAACAAELAGDAAWDPGADHFTGAGKTWGSRAR